MSDTPAIPAELPDNYKKLQALGKAHGMTVVGVSKVDLKAALDAKRAELEATPPEDTGDDSKDRANGADEGNGESGQETPPAPPEPKAKGGERVAITRTSSATGAWWCPVCDHSQTKLIGECKGCGAVRDGDEVVV